MSLSIKNLVFAGTGVRNAAYVGALLALEEAGLFSGLTAFAGTSSGSIVATLASLGYTPSEIRDQLLAFDFSKLEDGSLFGGPPRILMHYGWHKGEYLVERLGELIAQKTGNPRASFSECRERTGKLLRITGTNLSKRETRVFPDPSSWTLPVVDAVRISIAIPLFFEAKELAGDVYVDGGVLWNLPVEIFDDATGPNFETLGFVLKTSSDTRERTVNTLHEYVEGLFGAILREQEEDLSHNLANARRVVSIDDLGIATVNFGISEAQKLALIDSGRRATLEYLRNVGAKTA
jgi:NTE family protein